MTTQTRTRFSHAARLALFSLALAPVAVFAQQSDPAAAAPSSQDGAPPPRGGHGDRAERQAHMLEMMTKRLNLSPDQVTQIQAIQTDTRTQMQALHGDSSVQGADRRSKMMDLHKAENDKVRAVLNEEQRTKFDAMEAKRQERMHRGGDEQGPPPPPPQ